jgi:hypothetical protein
MKGISFRASFIGFILMIFLTGCVSQTKIDKTGTPTPQRYVNVTIGAKVSPPPTVTPLIDVKYRKIEVDGGNISGNREKLVVVGGCWLWRQGILGVHNEYGQLFKVTAKQIIPQNQSTEPVLAMVVFQDEAKVPLVPRERFG